MEFCCCSLSSVLFIDVLLLLCLVLFSVVGFVVAFSCVVYWSFFLPPFSCIFVALFLSVCIVLGFCCCSHSPVLFIGVSFRPLSLVFCSIVVAPLSLSLSLSLSLVSFSDVVALIPCTVYWRFF